MAKDVTLLNFARENTITYGQYTLHQRAVPDFRDGLKPVQRRILWSAYKMGLHYSGPVKKSARIVGECVGKYHPHGDGAVYQALVNMTKCNEPMMYGEESNFGDYEDGAAALRYTETKLTKYSDYYLLDPDYIAVTPMIPNYDGEYKEPVYLPSKVPNLLVNGSEGIATGCSLLVPSFSLESVKKLIKRAVENGCKATPKMCLKTLKFSFPYGGVVDSPKKIVYSYMKTGFKGLKFRPEYRIEDDRVIIESIAPRFPVSNKLEKLANMNGVKTVEDRRESGKIRFDVVFNRGFLRGKKREQLINRIKSVLETSLPCQTYVTTRHDDESVSFSSASIPELVNNWLQWRIEFEKTVLERLISVEEGKKNVQEWTLFAIEHKKEILKSLESDNPKKYMTEHFKLSEDCASFIMDLKVRNLARMESRGVKEKIKSHKKKIKELRDGLGKVEERITECI